MTGWESNSVLIWIIPASSFLASWFQWEQISLHVSKVKFYRWPWKRSHGPVQNSVALFIHLSLGCIGAHMGPGGVVHTAHWAMVRWRSADGTTESELGSANRRHPTGSPEARWTWILSPSEERMKPLRTELQQWNSKRHLKENTGQMWRIREQRNIFALVMSSCCI